MVRREYTDLELQSQILYTLYKHGKWSETYTPYQTFKNLMSNVVKNNGRNTDKQVKALVRQGLVFFRKNGKTIALNPYKKLTIVEIIMKYLRVGV